MQNRPGRWPLHATGTGQVLLPFAGPAVQAGVLAGPTCTDAHPAASIRGSAWLIGVRTTRSASSS